jgi:hypothetical protein
VDEKHSLIETGYLAESFESIFGRVMNLITEAIANISTQVIIVASHRDVHHHTIFPTPPFEESKNCTKLHMVINFLVFLHLQAGTKNTVIIRVSDKFSFRMVYFVWN